MDNKEIASIRKQYKLKSLDEKDVKNNPVAQFHDWLQEAISGRVNEPTAMNLATATSDGKPSARMVLLKGVDEQGFVFYTHYESRKGQQIEANAHVALTFFWAELERQVRIEGVVEKVSAAESDAYFNSRPEGSKAGASVSPQSRPIESRTLLESMLAEFLKDHPPILITRPEFWGGYRVVPHRIEFWQGRESRLHDRLEFLFEEDTWTLRRLAP